MYKVLFLVTIMGIFSVFTADAQPLPPSKAATHEAGHALAVKLIKASPNTWGYDIYSNGRLYIHQPSIPGLAGNAGFTTQQRARKAAAIVCRKIRQGITPPTLTIQELRAAQLIHQ